MINIAICDDVQKDSKNLKSLCLACQLTDHLSFELYDSGNSLISNFSINKFDILFLDIDMPEHNGISIGKQIRALDKNVIIIFCTSYPQYAIEAYDCEAFYYILKPCSQEKLQQVLNRAVKKLGLLHTYHTIKIQNKSLRLPISEIYYIEYCQKHIIYHVNGKKYETTGKFSVVYDELKKYGFFQVHQGYIVNLAKVQDFKGYSAILENGQDVLISVRKKRDVLLAYAKYVEDLA